MTSLNSLTNENKNVNNNYTLKSNQKSLMATAAEGDMWGHAVIKALGSLKLYIF